MMLARRVAGAVDGHRAGQRQSLEASDDVGRSGQAEGDAGKHRIDACPARLADGVEDIVDDVGIVADEAEHGIGSGQSVQRVGGGIAGDGIGERIADARGARARQCEVLDVGRQHERNRAEHNIDAGVRQFHDVVAGTVDDIGIPAGAAAHVIIAAEADQRVVTVEAVDLVVDQVVTVKRLAQPRCR